MSRVSSLPSWYMEDVVCLAIVPIGQIVDWSPGSYEPEQALWPPEGTFLRLQAIASELNLDEFASIAPYRKPRLSSDCCAKLLSRWDEMTDAVAGTPGAGWAAAMGLLLQLCARSHDLEVLIEGP